jgi:hypothetical protein
MEVITKMNRLPFLHIVGVTGIEFVNGMAQKRQIYYFSVFIE